MNLIVNMHSIKSITDTGHSISIECKRTKPVFCSSDTLNLRMTKQIFKNLIKSRLGLTIKEFQEYSFTSTTKHFDEALLNILYDRESITPKNIEDKILVPALNNLNIVDTNTFNFDTLDKYWDICIDKGLLYKTMNRDYNNFYDAIKWCEHLNTKLTKVQIETVPEDNEYIITKPKGSSYWYLKNNR